MESTGEGLNTSQIQSLKDAIDSGNTAGAQDLLTQISAGPKADSFDAMGPRVEGTGTAGLVEKRVGDEVHMVRADGKEGPPSGAAVEGAAEEARLGVTRDNAPEVHQQAQVDAVAQQEALMQQVAVEEAKSEAKDRPFTWKDMGKALLQLLTLGLIGKFFGQSFKKTMNATNPYRSDAEKHREEVEAMIEKYNKEKDRRQTSTPPGPLPQAS